MPVKITYFVHGTTTDNIEHKSTGWLQGELSEKGIQQSIILKEQIDVKQFDIVFCSDLKRAIDSAKYTFEGEKQIICDSRLRECNYGDLNGKDTRLVNYEEHIQELTEVKPWEEAIEKDWRKTKSWQPGWEYEIKE